MGLDITAYRDCTPVAVELDDEGQPTRDDVVRAWVNGNYPERAEGLQHLRYYVHGDSMDFSAGPYSAYDAWRRELARIGGYEAEDAWEGRVDTAPFLEMVDFADNEGVIGPATCTKLAQDFAAHEDTARAAMSKQHFGLYAKWWQAFELARHNGFVRFH